MHATARGSKSAKVTTWDRTVVCLPQTYPNVGADAITIPRKKRPILARHGLIGKIHLESDWSEDAIFAVVRSVFRDAMGADLNFPFKFLVPTGGDSKSLTKPVVSTTFKWTSKEVAGRADSTIYGTWHNKVTVYVRTYAHTSNRTYSHIRPCVDPCVHPYVTHRKHTPVRKIT